jgi:ATP-dependent exoDNAse (exonuclease V) beta subunit
LKISIDKHHFFSDLIEDSIYEISKKLETFHITFNYQNFIRLPFYESIEEIIRSFKLTESSDAYLQFFLDEVLHYTQKSSESVQGFLEYWDQKKESLSIVVPEGKDAVRIMTIHKSKGLEFPVVIFPYDLDIYREQNPKIWYPIKEKEQFNNFDSLLINYNKSLEQTGNLGKDLYESKRNELELDNFNLLYVTLTRAIEQLYIISESKKITDVPKFYSQFFVEYLKAKSIFNEQETTYSFGIKKRLLSKVSRSEKSFELERFISTPWQDHNINVAVNASLFWDEDKQESIAFGNLIHEMLSKIKTSSDINDVIAQYYTTGLIQKDNVKQIEKLISNVINHSQMKPYFKQNSTVYNEREILTTDKEIIIPDRLVIDENSEAIIIDYKTGKPDKKYHFQLEKYAKTIHQLGYNVKKKLLVYISDNIQIEEV